MADTVTVAGLIATPIKHTVTSDGLEISSFRLASSSRRYDRAAHAWVDGETNWFTVTAFRQLAANVQASLDKGHRIVVSGRLRVREWRNGEQLGRDVEIIADALGPDLAWGRAQYTRTPRQAPSEGTPAAVAPVESAAAQPEDLEALDAAEAPEERENIPAEAHDELPVPF